MIKMNEVMNPVDKMYIENSAEFGIPLNEADREVTSDKLVNAIQESKNIHVAIIGGSSVSTFSKYENVLYHQESNALWLTNQDTEIRTCISLDDINSISHVEQSDLIFGDCDFDWNLSIDYKNSELVVRLAFDEEENRLNKINKERPSQINEFLDTLENNVYTAILSFNSDKLGISFYLDDLAVMGNGDQFGLRFQYQVIEDVVNKVFIPFKEILAITKSNGLNGEIIYFIETTSGLVIDIKVDIDVNLESIKR